MRQRMVPAPVPITSLASTANMRSVSTEPLPNCCYFHHSCQCALYCHKCFNSFCACCTSSCVFILNQLLPPVQVLLNARQMHIATMAPAIAILATLEITALRVSVLLAKFAVCCMKCHSPHLWYYGVSFKCSRMTCTLISTLPHNAMAKRVRSWKLLCLCHGKQSSF